jgi:hypothetical protein
MVVITMTGYRSEEDVINPITFIARKPRPDYESPWPRPRLEKETKPWYKKTCWIIAMITTVIALLMTSCAFMLAYSYRP